LLENWYCQDCKEIINILNPPSDENDYSSESLADYGGLFVGKKSDDSGISDMFEEFSQSDEKSHDVALMGWKDDGFLIGSDSSSNSNLDSDSDKDKML